MKRTSLAIIALLVACVTLLSILPVYAGEETTKISATVSSDIEYVGNWTTAGETKRSSKADEYCQYTFSGTGIDIWFGRGAGAGIAEILIDGVSMGEVDMYKSAAATELMYSKKDLENKEHTVKIVNTGKKSGSNTNVNLAYFIIYAPAPESDVESIKIGINNPDIVYTGTWTQAGETMRSAVKDHYCEYTFKGTGVDIWFGRGAGAGIAEIFIDGTSMGKVDMYKSTAATELMYSKTDLAYGTHTVKILNTGEKSGNNTNINLAYFTVYVPKEMKEFDTVKSQDSQIIYDGNWTLVGETMRSTAADQFCEYTFAGKGLEIYFGMGPGAGISEVFIDGVSKGTVDAYSATSQISRLFTVTDLEYGIHTVKLVNTGDKNAASSSTNVNLASFNVELGEAPLIINAVDNKFTTDATKALTIVAGGCAATVEDVLIDGEALVSDTDYTASDLTVTINQGALDKLEAGSYTLTIVTTKGNVEASLTVEKNTDNDDDNDDSQTGGEDNDDQENVPTGDGTAVILVTLLASLAAIAVITNKRKSFEK